MNRLNNVSYGMPQKFHDMFSLSPMTLPALRQRQVTLALSWTIGQNGPLFKETIIAPGCSRLHALPKSD